MEDQENKNMAPVKYGVIGLVVGLGVGVVAGMALSPKSGKENREFVVNQYVRGKEVTMSKLKKTKKDDKSAAKKDDKSAAKKAPAKK